MMAIGRFEPVAVTRFSCFERLVISRKPPLMLANLKS
jgi:hypothetical protein